PRMPARTGPDSSADRGREDHGAFDSRRAVSRLLALAAVAGATLTAVAAGTAGTGARLRVGYVTDAPAATDGGVGELMYRGFVRAVRELGVDGRILEVAPTDDPSAALTKFAQQRYDLIIAGAFIPPDPVDTLALRFPHVKFFT